MQTRRSFLSSTSAAAAVLAMAPFGSAGADTATPAEGALATRAIPATGEKIPVIGMGTSGSFEVGEGTPEYDALREVLKVFFAGGGTVIDTAPTYSNAEDVLGALLAEQNLRPKTWLATKLSGVRGRDAGLAQFNNTLGRLKTDKVELLQVHNLGDLKTQLALARELKAEGKTRYVGVTHYLEYAHDELADIVAAEKPDFLQINYSVVTRGAEKRLFPLAKDLGVAVMINRAFEDGKLFGRVKDKPLPDWTAAAGITSWAQAFLKFALSNPAVTVVIPATGKPHRQADNLKAGLGPNLTEEQRASLIAALA
ncbi:aldo/keto reductase [Hyphomicrobium sp.]|uniref:aldo/keto reductase n=1 Tax=Hyphomicrobium sp. TaxID=82 RepID=UPI0025BAA95B|nr:aldo/keto reductase [Hyphomicrobium sp.]